MIEKNTSTILHRITDDLQIDAGKLQLQDLQIEVSGVFRGFLGV